MSWEGCRPEPILLLLIFRQLQIPSSPFCNKITGFTHHGLQFFFLILKHFSFQKKKGFVGHLGPLPGFFQTQVWPQSFMSGFGGVIQTFILHSRTAPGRNFRLKSSASLGLLSFRVWYILSRNVLSFRRGTSGASKPLAAGLEGFFVESWWWKPAKSDGWNQHLHLLFQQCHFQVRSTLGGKNVVKELPVEHRFDHALQPGL